MQLSGYQGNLAIDPKLLLDEMEAFPLGLRAFAFNVTYSVVVSVRKLIILHDFITYLYTFHFI